MKIGDVITNNDGSQSKVTSVSRYGNYYSTLPVEEEKAETAKKSAVKRKK